jgi:RHS repeat-associated protein
MVVSFMRTTCNQGIASLLDNNFDTTNVSRPHAYLVWMVYDSRMVLDPTSSGAVQVQNPNALETLIQNAININVDGYIHAYVSNGSASKVNFDNFLVTHMRGKVRQINDYYPYGLSIDGINGDYDEYLNKYTSKELQTGEFDPLVSTGLEMFDFHARFYDPQLGRWHAPDPAMQFSNPYLGIGNNPVMYVDPDGEFAIIAGLIIKKAIMAAKVAKVAKVAGAAGKAVSMTSTATTAGSGGKFAAMMGKAVSKKGIKGGLRSGAINSISNFDSEEGLGWNTIGDFAAGFAGGSLGVGFDSKLVGMGVGGLGNWGVNGASFDYKGAQNFVGGALSAYSGIGKGVKAKKTIFEKGNKYPLWEQRKTHWFSNLVHKNMDSFIKYGVQASAYDFAYTKQKDYVKRTAGQHVGLFLTGGVMGATADKFFLDDFGEMNGFWRSSIGAGAYTAEWFISSRIKKLPKNGFKWGGSSRNKSWVLGGKWVVGTSELFGQ